MKIKVIYGQRETDFIIIEVKELTDAQEIYNAARAQLDGSAVAAVMILEKVQAGRYEVIQ